MMDGWVKGECRRLLAYHSSERRIYDGLMTCSVTMFLHHVLQTAGDSAPFSDTSNSAHLPMISSD